eukprot:CAMPEP_0176043260 /NCGR_PEP_ID=MMETSP0120_2-20121206/21467_1 /TAXON_ID=160619 /ORGANISM="Kryptoperidinium foliaceum, Strain CCMP 1326" /LENGTH=686 /DNA_ID=CAMNT_0017376667 /DNA_START=60 /DNA_END=2120 /DNA_ORIENTATION=+
MASPSRGRGRRSTQSVSIVDGDATPLSPGTSEGPGARPASRSDGRPGSGGDCARLVRLLSNAMAKECSCEENRRPAIRGSKPSSPKAGRLEPLPIPAAGGDAECFTPGRFSGRLRKSGTVQQIQRSGALSAIDNEGEVAHTAGVRLAPLPVTGLPEEPSALPSALPSRRTSTSTGRPSAGRTRPGALCAALAEAALETSSTDGARRRTPSQTRLAALRRAESTPTGKSGLSFGFGDFLKNEPTPARVCLQRCGAGAQLAVEEDLIEPVVAARRSLEPQTCADGGGDGEARTASAAAGIRPTALLDLMSKDTNSSASGEGDAGVQSTLLCRRHMPSLAVSVQRGSGSRQVGNGLFASLPRKDIVQLHSAEKIFDLYQWDEVLQETGDGGKVVVCKPKSNPASPTRLAAAPSIPTSSEYTYVLKIRSKESLAQDCMEEQFRKSLLRVLNLPGHIGVLPIHEVLEDEKFYYIVMAKAEGAFFNILLTEFGDGVMPAASVRKLTQEILEALGHVHMQGILHRDVKPDNLVFQALDDPKSPTGKSNKVSLIDFDHAEPDWTPGSGSSQSQWCGTVRFSAPETFNGTFSQSSDLYSVGVILYMLLAGKMPYDDAVFEEFIESRTPSPKRSSRYDWRHAIHRRMRETPIDWQCEPWPSQPLCREFCQTLLAFEANDRPASAEDALRHAWFASE